MPPAVIMRWRTGLPAFAYLLLVFQEKLESGSSFLFPIGHPNQERYGSFVTDTNRLHYTTDTNGFESSGLSNATSAVAKTSKSNGSAVQQKENPVLGDNDKLSWTKNIDDSAKPAAGTLGDIMSRDDVGLGAIVPGENLSELVARRDGLVTSAIQTGTLASQFGIEHPLDRMALTANGNLQRLVSSYYDSPVEVLVDYCRPYEDNGSSKLMPQAEQTKQWDRLVHLNVHNQTFCKAHSIITVFDPLCQKLVESNEVGLGQLFRYLDILPEFELHNAGPYPKETGGGFWREYSLKCAELSCFIHEDFRKGIWDLHPSKF